MIFAHFPAAQTQVLLARHSLYYWPVFILRPALTANQHLHTAGMKGKVRLSLAVMLIVFNTKAQAL